MVGKPNSLHLENSLWEHSEKYHGQIAKRYERGNLFTVRCTACPAVLQLGESATAASPGISGAGQGGRCSATRYREGGRSGADVGSLVDPSSMGSLPHPAFH